MWGRFQRPSAWMLLALALFGAWIAFRYWRAAADAPAVPVPEPLPEGDYRVLGVLDGGAILVGPLTDLQNDSPLSPGWQAEIRPIGLDFPSAEARAGAKAFAESLLQSGKVRLRFDKRRRDGASALVAYLFVGDEMLNEELLRAGLARSFSPPGEVLILERQLRAAEQEARVAKRGLWAP